VDFNKTYSKTIIVVKFQDNQMREVRKEIKNYLKDYKLDKQIIIYYFLSFLPLRLTKLLREKM
jgi:hypothetical protein